MARAANASGPSAIGPDNGRPKQGCRPDAEEAGVHSMEDPYELALAMLGLALTAMMLVAGALYLIATPSPEPTFPAPVPGSVF